MILSTYLGKTQPEDDKTTLPQRMPGSLGDFAIFGQTTVQVRIKDLDNAERFDQSDFSHFYE